MQEHLKKLIIPTADGQRHEIAVPTPADLAVMADRIASLAGENEALRDELAVLRREAVVKTGLVGRLVDIGYTHGRAANIIGGLPHDEAPAKVALREGLAGIGYTVTEIEECMEDVPALKQEDIDHAREIMEAWSTATTALSRNGVTFEDDQRLVVFPKVDFSNVKTIDYGGFCSGNLAYMPLLDTSNVTSAMAAFSSSGAHGTPGHPKMRRIPQWDFSSLVSMNGGLTGFLPELEICPPLSFPKAKHLKNLFGGCPKLREIPQVDWPDTVVGLEQAFAGVSPEVLPFGGDMKKASSLKLLLASNWHELPGGKDLSGQTLRSSAPLVELTGLFQGARVKEMPALEFEEVNSLCYFFAWAEITPRVIPDMSRWERVEYWQWFLWPYSNCTERVEGLNLASAKEESVCPFFHTYPTGLNKLRYIRMINLGKGPSKDYDFSPVTYWGDNDEANPDALKSLVDTLLTDSYDRAAAGMPAATVRLSSAVRSRLTQEQKAAITAKGFTITG